MAAPKHTFVLGSHLGFLLLRAASATINTFINRNIRKMKN